MLTEKEKWIGEVLDSLDGARPAGPSPFLYEKIVHRLRDPKSHKAPSPVLWLAAAAFAVLLVLNIGIVHAHGGQAAPQEARQLAGGYHLLNTNAITY
jgi:hypothetical protein